MVSLNTEPFTLQTETKESYLIIEAKIDRTKTALTSSTHGCQAIKHQSHLYACFVYRWFSILINDLCFLQAAITHIPHL